MLLISGNSFAQEKDTVNWCLDGKNLYVGSDSIESKRIISGFWLRRLTETEFEIDLTILDDWKLMDSIKIKAVLDIKTLYTNCLFVEIKDEKTPAVRLSSENGMEVYLAKTGGNGIPERKCTFLSHARIVLPEDEKHYVSELPVMYVK